MDRRDTARLITVAVLAVATAGVAVWHLRGSTSNQRASRAASPTPGSEGSTPRGFAAGLQPRSVDPAGMPLEWVRPGAEVSPPDSAPPLHERIRGEEDLEELMGLLEWSRGTGHLGELGERMAKCSARFEPQLEEDCGWEMTVVLRRSTEQTGQIAYASAAITNGDEQAACRAFAACWTKEWVHRDDAPMPEGVGDELVFSQVGRGSSWNSTRGVEAADYYRSAAATEAQQLRTLEAQANEPTAVTSSSMGWNMLFLQHRVDEYQCMLDVLQEREGACRS